jgi:serine/threonine-protein kinase
MEQIGKYRILGEIGRGAMGEVYRAHDPILNRFVAVKTMSANIAGSEDLRKRFHREAQAAALLNHPAIVTVFDFGEESGKIYLAMEFLEGTDLKEAIAEGTVGTLKDKLGIMEQVCDGLTYAHAKQVVHRDLKPGNIQILPNGHVKIMDFGLARLGSSEMTQAGVVVGTPNYMSPEQVLGDKIDARSDVFSLGAVFYELLTSRKPFDATAVPAVLYQVVHKEPTPIAQLAPDLPVIFAQTVERMLAKDKGRRFRDAGEVREVLAFVRHTLSSGRIDRARLDTSGRPYMERKADGTADSDPNLVPAPAAAPDRDWWYDGTAAATALDPKHASPTPDPAARPAPVRKPSTPGSSPTLSGSSQTLSGSSQTLTGSSGSSPSIPARSRTQTSMSGVTRPADRSGAGASPRAGSRAPLAIGAVAIVVIAGAAAAFVLTRTPPAPVAPTPAPGEPAKEQVSALKEALVGTQIELAERNLEDKDYRSAISQAERALKLDPQSAGAQRVLQQARGRLEEVDRTAKEAEAQFQAGDAAAASESLSRLLVLDPQHPVAVELSNRLNSAFRSQAEGARRLMDEARAAAEQVRAETSEPFERGAARAREAASLFGSGEFAEATRGWLEARDAFDRARRAAAPKRPAMAPTAVASAAPRAPASPADVAPKPAPSAAVPAPTVAEPAPPPVAAPKPRPLVVSRTVVKMAGASARSGLEGFDASDVTVMKRPDVAGRLEFEVQPPQLEPGARHTVKLYLVNDGKRALKPRTVVLTTVIEGARAPVTVTPLAKEIAPRQRALLAEAGGVWGEGGAAWALEALVTSDRGDTLQSQVSAR